MNKEILKSLAKVASELDKLGLSKQADQVDAILNKIAQPRAEAYYQRDPRTGMYRGILEVVGEDGVVKFMPEKPLVDKNLNALKLKLQSLVQGMEVNDKGVGEPWYPESNMPFDAKGNRVA